MSGDEGTLGVGPGGAVALEQRAYGNADQQPRIETDKQWRQQTELGAIGSISRLIHRAGILTLLVGTSAALVAWVAGLIWGALWVWGQLPSV